MSFQALTNLVWRARPFGRVILLPVLNGYAKIEQAKSKCTSYQETTRNVAFRSLLTELGLPAFIFIFLRKSIRKLSK